MLGRHTREFDVFISHATEDKDFAGPLAHELRSAGLRVWFDEFELGLGDSLNPNPPIHTGGRREDSGRV